MPQESDAAPKKTKKKPKKAPVEVFWGTGRRKSSVARVRVWRGTGEIKINGREVDAYFPNHRIRSIVRAPLLETSTDSKYDIGVNVGGGGFTGQADACKLGIARALKKHDTELEDALRDSGLLTRDGRMKERKKCGLHGARRGTQFSKR